MTIVYCLAQKQFAQIAQDKLYYLIICLLLDDESIEESDGVQNENQSADQLNVSKASNTSQRLDLSIVNALHPPVPWKDDVTVPPPQVEFHGKRVANLPKNFTVTPLSVFLLMLGKDFFKNLVQQTNIYASACLYKKSRSSSAKQPNFLSHSKPWTAVDEEEMKKFFSLLFAMALNPKAQITHFWSTKSFLHCAFFGKTMPRNRFLNILQFLHVVDNKNRANPTIRKDKLWKIRPFVDSLSLQFKTLYHPGKQLSLDEGTCPFKGRVSFATYNPRKPNKYGMKLYQVCDGFTGYCCNFKVSTNESIGIEQLVFDLLRDHLGKGHEVYMDRYYTAVALFHKLFAQKTIAVGTCMANRKGLPKDLMNQKLRKGKVLARRQGPVMVLKWFDKREVVMLSTKHTSAMEKVKIKIFSGSCYKHKPIAVIDYNKYMSGVDMIGQMIQYYKFNRRTVKWWKKLFFHLVSLALVNAQKLYNLQKIKEGQKTLDLFHFVSSLVEDLTVVTVNKTKEVPDPIRNVKSCRVIDPRYRHFMERISCTEKRIRRCCEVCRKQREMRVQPDDEDDAGPSSKRSRRTEYQCSLCKVALCFGKCFAAYHSKAEYWK